MDPDSDCDEVEIFVPPCCPNPECAMHRLPEEGFPNGYIWYVHRGVKRSVHQFVCKECSRCFSESTFKLSYYEKVTLDYDEILAACRENITLEAWSFELKTTSPTLKIRLYKLLWMICQRLEDRIESGECAGAYWETVDLLAEVQAAYVKRKGWVYPILRDLIFRFKVLLAGAAGGGEVETAGGGAGDGGGRLLIHDLKQNVLQILRALLGPWSYRLAGSISGRCDWRPFHATE